MTRLARWMLVAGLAGLPLAAGAHGGLPRIVSIRFPAQRPGEVWAVADDIGLLVRGAEGVRWLCAAAFHFYPRLRDMTPVGAGADVWLAASTYGLYRSEQGGCGFELLGGVLQDHVPTSLSPRPDVPDEVLLSTETIGKPNDVFLSTDAGRTWTGAGLNVDGRVRPPLLRTKADPRVVYVAHAGGATRSDDGGRTFTPITLGPPDLNVVPEEFAFLADHPRSALEVYAVVERFPTSYVVRSRDGGETWEPALEMEDVPDTMVFDRAGQRGLIVTPFVGIYRSVDGGDTWTHEETPPVDLLGCVTREPDSDRLWGCTDTNFMGPWVFGSSDDFGATWTPALTAFAQVDGPWACPPDSKSGQACFGRCPVPATPNTPDAACPSAGAADAAVGAPEAGAPADAGPVADGAPVADATPSRPDASSHGGGGGGGCAAAGAPLPLAPLLLAAPLLRRRRSRR